MPKRALLIATAALLCATAAAAQDPSVPQKGQDSDPQLPAPKDQIPEKVRPDAGGGSEGGPTLSEKLEKSDGVIKPPGDVDPEIKTIPPDPSPDSTPVIRPPGNAK